MGIFNKLLGGGEKKPEEILGELVKSRDKKDFLSMAKQYYSLGEVYLKQGEVEKALLYLNRFDNLAGSRDDLYDKIGDKKIDQASVWIEKLEEEGMYSNEIRDRAESMGQNLDQKQICQWNLLTLARFCNLFSRLSALAGFELLAKLDKVTEILSQMFYRPLTGDEYGLVRGFVEEFYPFTDSQELADTSNRIKIQGGDDLEAYDITGGETLLNMYTLLDDLLRLLEGNGEETEVSCDFVTNSVLADYYIRTRRERVRNVPEVRKEAERVWADYEFVRDNPSQEEFLERMKQYRAVVLPLI